MILYVLALAIITYGPWIFLTVLLWRGRRSPVVIAVVLSAMVLFAIASSSGTGLLLKWAISGSLWLLLLGWLAYSQKWLFAGLANACGLLFVLNFARNAHQLASVTQPADGYGARDVIFVGGFITASLLATLVGALLGNSVRGKREQQGAF